MTDHVKDQLCARIEELEAEKLELNEQLDALQEERGALHNRPDSCRNELQAQGKPYPKSGCAVCGNGGMAGCPYEARQPSTHLARLKAQWQSEALVNAVAACFRIAKGQRGLANMHLETLADGEEVVGEQGIPYSNKALGAMHCKDEIGRMVTELRRQAEGGEE